MSSRAKRGDLVVQSASESEIASSRSLLAITNIFHFCEKKNTLFRPTGLAAVEKIVQQIRLPKEKAKHRQERLPQPSFSDDLPEGKQGVARSAVSVGFAWRM